MESSVTSSIEGTPEGRVQAFIKDFHANWRKMAESYREPEERNQFSPFPIDPDEMEKEHDDLLRRHFTAKAIKRGEFSGCGFSDPPEHDPKTEKITRSEISGDRAVVETFLETGWESFHEFELEKVSDDWRISSILMFFEPTGVPLVPDKERQRLLGLIDEDPDFPDLPKGAEPNCNRLFEDGRKIAAGLRPPRRLEVRRVGMIRIDSGAVGAYDFGWAADASAP